MTGWEESAGTANGPGRDHHCFQLGHRTVTFVDAVEVTKVAEVVAGDAVPWGEGEAKVRKEQSAGRKDCDVDHAVDVVEGRSV